MTTHSRTITIAKGIYASKLLAKKDCAVLALYSNIQYSRFDALGLAAHAHIQAVVQCSVRTEIACVRRKEDITEWLQSNASTCI